MTLPEAWVPSWAMDVAAVIAAAPSPPRRPDLAAAKALMLLGLASLWVGFAATGAAAVTVAAYGYGEVSPVFRVLAETTVRATVLALLLASFAMVLVRRAAVCDAGFREELIRHGQIIVWESERERGIGWRRWRRDTDPVEHAPSDLLRWPLLCSSLQLFCGRSCSIRAGKGPRPPELRRGPTPVVRIRCSAARSSSASRYRPRPRRPPRWRRGRGLPLSPQSPRPAS